MTMSETRGMRCWPLSALMLVALLGAPAFAMYDGGTPAYTSAADVRVAQSILQEEHLLKAGRFTPGRMDGPTVDALVDFQRDHAIPQSGALDQETMAQLTSHRRGIVGAGTTEPAAARTRSQAPSTASTASSTGSDSSATGATAAASGARSMPATASSVPLMAALGTILLVGGILLVARRRRA